MSFYYVGDENRALYCNVLYNQLKRFNKGLVLFEQNFSNFANECLDWTYKFHRHVFEFRQDRVVQAFDTTTSDMCTNNGTIGVFNVLLK